MLRGAPCPSSVQDCVGCWIGEILVIWMEEDFRHHSCWKKLAFWVFLCGPEPYHGTVRFSLGLCSGGVGSGIRGCADSSLGASASRALRAGVAGCRSHRLEPAVEALRAGIIIYPKPYSIYLRGTISICKGIYRVQGLGLMILNLESCDPLT